MKPSLSSSHGSPRRLMVEDESSSSSIYSSSSGIHTKTSVSSDHVGDELLLRNKIIAREERHVRKARWAVCYAILLCCTALSIAVYGVAKRAEYKGFIVEFELYAEKMLKLVQWEVQYNFALMQQLSASVTTASLETGGVFPFVTQSYFEIAGGYADGMGGIMSVAFVPLVGDNQRPQWEEYSVKHQGWVEESKVLRQIHPGHREPMYGTNQDHEQDRRRRHLQFRANNSTLGVSDTIFRWENGSKVAMQTGFSKVYAPIWQVSPPDATSVNADLFSEKLFTDLYDNMIATKHTVLSPATAVGDMFDFVFDDDKKDKKTDPHAFIMEPVYSAYEETSELVGMVIAITTFGNLLDRLLPVGANGVVCVISDACGNIISYELNGPSSTFLGYEDMHDPKFNDFRRSFTMELYQTVVDGLCQHTVDVYPSKSLRASFDTATPILNASMVVLAFAVTSLLLVMYDKTVTQRQEKTMKSALRSGALIEKMFPANVRDRVMDVNHGTISKTEAERGVEACRFKERPIAEFYPNTTLMWFTAWSSAREPFQVFQLLEAIFGAFDDIAKKRRIFKVETVGDCYVAVCGIPVARNDHAVVMSRFARDCMLKVGVLLKQLEVQFGPDTSSLHFRIGLHSGPVTGGVLRGDNARFQLFGDTVNTAARMESTGIPSCIHISQSTADLLSQASKGNWFVPREDVVHAKGKGAMQTYWLVCSDAVSSSEGTARHDTEHDPVDDEMSSLDRKTNRLIDWNTDILLRLLKLVVMHRATHGAPTTKQGVSWSWDSHTSTAIMDEVVEVIEFADRGIDDTTRLHADDTVISEVVKDQLRAYVASIAARYKKNPFHNFEHASHVVMSVGKLLGRIVAPSPNATSHDDTHKITSDPLTQFACVFSALIHDVDHSGVPNTQLVKEQAPVARIYKNHSVAEQNSVHVAWSLLSEPRFGDLCRTLSATMEERTRFRQLVVNAVMATDIMAPDLKQLRNQRWAKVFDAGAIIEEYSLEMKHRKATIVIEHLLQASDVSHTMQHWHIFRQWNERLFQEQCLAFDQGRSDVDPAETWYQGELNFFDYYIIPLARKLAQCGVFGVCSDEYLNYAVKNREEWQARGADIVARMIEQRRYQEGPQVALVRSALSLGHMDAIKATCNEGCNKGCNEGCNKGCNEGCNEEPLGPMGAENNERLPRPRGFPMSAMFFM